MALKNRQRDWLAARRAYNRPNNANGDTAMNLRKPLCLIVLALGSAHAFAQDADARSVIARASSAMGLDGVTSLYYYGSGRQLQPRAEQQRQQSLAADALNDYVRAIDFASRLRAPRGPPMPRRSPAAPPTGQCQQNITPTRRRLVDTSWKSGSRRGVS